MTKEPRRYRYKKGHVPGRTVGKKPVYRWMACNCRIEEDEWGTYYHQRAIGCTKPHAFTGKMLQAWARQHDKGLWKSVDLMRVRKGSG